MLCCRALQTPDIETCSFYDGLESAGPDGRLDAGVYTMHDLRVLGRKKNWCPYFLARHMIAFANVVVYNYQYMIDPKVRVECMCRGTSRLCYPVC